MNILPLVSNVQNVDEAKTVVDNLCREGIKNIDNIQAQTRSDDHELRGMLNDLRASTEQFAQTYDWTIFNRVVEQARLVRDTSQARIDKATAEREAMEQRMLAPNPEEEGTQQC